MGCKSCGSAKRVVARGLCRNCYARWYKRGTTAYAPKPEKVTCSVGDCFDWAIAKGMCDKHYRRVKLHGDAEDAGPVDWGARSKHPMYHSWKWMRRHKCTTPVCQEWLDDFWQYVFDVGERPSPKHKMFRADRDQPLGKNNFVWKRSIIERVDGESPNTYQARAAKVQRALSPERYEDYSLKHNYGMSKTELESMLDAQNNECAICHTKEILQIKGKKLRLSIDHCHKTGKIRGLLCSNCNRGLGYFKDNPELLKRAELYLLSEPA